MTTVTTKKTQEQANMEAIIEHDGDEKYILATAGSGESQKTVVVSLPFEYHSDIKRAYARRLNGKAGTLEVLGGGILTIDREAKSIRTYGQSGSFGKPPRDLVEAVLKESFPDFSLDVTVTDYVRG